MNVSHRPAEPLRLLALALAAVLLTVLVAACGSGGSDSTSATTASASSGLEGSVKIGAVLPLTGGSAALGKDQQRGIELAVEGINSGGGVDGKELEVEFEDSETTTSPAVQAARLLASVDKVPVVIGELLSGNTIAIAKYLERVGVPMINPASSSTELAEVGADDPLFSSVISLDDVYAGYVAEKTYEAGYRNVATLVPNNSYGLGLSKAFAKEFESLGGKVSPQIAYAEGQSSYQTELEKLEDSDAEAYIYTAYEPDSVTLLKNAYALDLDPKKFIGLYISTAATGEGAEAAVGQYGFDLGVASDSGFTKAYEAAYGESVQTPYSGLAYDAVGLAAQGIEAAGSTNPKAVGEAIRQVGDKGFDGVTGPVKLDADGMRSNQPYAAFEVGPDGKLEELPELPGPEG